MTLIVAAKCPEGVAISADSQQRLQWKDGREKLETGIVKVYFGDRYAFGAGLGGIPGGVNVPEELSGLVTLIPHATPKMMAMKLLEVSREQLGGLAAFVVVGFDNTGTPDLWRVGPTSGAIRLQDEHAFAPVGTRVDTGTHTSSSLEACAAFTRQAIFDAIAADPRRVGPPVFTYAAAKANHQWQSVLVAVDD